MELTGRSRRFSSGSVRRPPIKWFARRRPADETRLQYGRPAAHRRAVRQNRRSLWVQKSLVAELEFGSRNPRAARRWSWSGVPVRCCRRRPLCRSRRCSQVAWHLRAGAGGNDHLGVAPPEASAGSWFAPFVVRWSSITQPFRSAGCSVIARHRWCGLPSRAKKPESLRSAVFAAGRGGRIALGRPLHQSSAFGRCCRVWSNERMQLTARVLRFAPVSIRRLGLRSARAARLRNEPPAGVRWVHGGRQLMRKPLCSTRRGALWPF